MKKTLIASAIAAATFSGSVLAQESNLPTIYGNIQYAAVWSDVEDGPSSFQHRDNGSTLGIKHSHEIAPGITGFFKLELEGIAADDKGGNKNSTLVSDGAGGYQVGTDNAGINELDEAYIGIKGDSFGQVWIGSDDSTYERAVDVIAQYYEAADLSIGAPYTTGEGDLVQYMSPSFGGLSLWGAVQVRGDADRYGVEDNKFPYQLAAVYSADMLELALAMDSNDNGDGNNENTYGARASVDLDALTLVGEFHTRDDDYDKYGLGAVYTIGANRFALSYELAEEDGGDDLEQDTITVQALHNLSDNMYVYFEGYLGGGDDVYDTEDPTNPTSDEASVAAVGAVYYF